MCVVSLHQWIFCDQSSQPILKGHDFLQGHLYHIDVAKLLPLMFYRRHYGFLPWLHTLHLLGIQNWFLDLLIRPQDNFGCPENKKCILTEDFFICVLDYFPISWINVTSCMWFHSIAKLKSNNDMHLIWS